MTLYEIGKRLYLIVACLYIPCVGLISGEVLARDNGFGGMIWMLCVLPLFLFFFLGFIEVGCFAGREHDRANRTPEELCYGRHTAGKGLLLMILALLAGLSVGLSYGTQEMFFLIFALIFSAPGACIAILLCIQWGIGMKRFGKWRYLRELFRPGARVFAGCLAVLLAFSLGFTVFLHTHEEIDGYYAEELSEYDEYILYRRRYFAGWIFSHSQGEKVWFLPGQKAALLRAVRQDVEEILADETESLSREVASCEINEDFTRITVYYYEDGDASAVERRVYLSVAKKMEFYHELNGSDPQDTVQCVPVPREG